MKSFSKTVFDYISLAYPQNYETKNYLKKLDLKKIKYIGNLKFTETNYNSNENLKETLKTQLLAKKIWIASSTHYNEEIYCAKAHQKLKNYWRIFNQMLFISQLKVRWVLRQEI